MGDNERAALDQAAAEIEDKRLVGMAAKSEEFLAGGGKLYVEAGE
jgi:phosphomethylpyrimidine synthase